MKQVPLSLAPEPQATFESFVAGGNAGALAHLAGRTPPATPVYLWGGTGCGKSHLLHALAAACQQAGLHAGWFEPATALPWVFDAGWAFVVFDDVQAFDAARQQAAFAMLVEAQSHGVAWAAAGDRPPVDLPLRDDLRTRIGWGHVFAIEPLGEAETRAVLRREADRRGIFLSDDVMDYLLSRFQRDLGHLMHLLGRLDGYSLSKSRAVTVPLLKLMLSEESLHSEPAA